MAAQGLSSVKMKNMKGLMMKYFSIMLALLVGISLVLVACGQGDSSETKSQEIKNQETEVVEESSSYQSISAAQLAEMTNNKDFFLVNVHIPYAGEIPKTDLSVPYNEIEDRLSEFPKDKEEKLVLYCRSGSMSAIAAETMVKLGFTNIWTLTGGMMEWESLGHELLQRTDEARIHFDNRFVSLGKATIGQRIDYAFKFQNIGGEPLIISEVKRKTLEGC